MALAMRRTESEKRLIRPLKVLVPLIQQDLKHGREAAERAGLPYYEAAGEKMNEARPQLKHGEFKPWIQRNFSISYSQARRYMALAESTNGTKSSARDTFDSLREFERSVNPDIGTGKTSWHEPVTRIIKEVDTETLNLKRDELKRADEREAQRELGLQLIDIGYKVLARTLHPDKGGSKAAMARLNEVRDRLKQHA